MQQAIPGWKLICREKAMSERQRRSFSTRINLITISIPISSSMPMDKAYRHAATVLVVMESYDEWPFLKKYASLGVTQNLKALAQKGLYFDKFLPASGGTMQSLSSIISGFPYTLVEINYQVTAHKPYPSSIAETFKRLGYRTRLFYGGYLSWQRSAILPMIRDSRKFTVLRIC